MEGQAERKPPMLTGMRMIHDHGTAHVRLARDERRVTRGRTMIWPRGEKEGDPAEQTPLEGTWKPARCGMTAAGGREYHEESMF